MPTAPWVAVLVCVVTTVCAVEGKDERFFAIISCRLHSEMNEFICAIIYSIGSKAAMPCHEMCRLYGLNATINS